MTREVRREAEATLVDDWAALAAKARAAKAAYDRMLELNGGIGLLGVEHPEMFEDLLDWDNLTLLDNGLLVRAFEALAAFSVADDRASAIGAAVARVREADQVRRIAQGLRASDDFPAGAAW